jgi:hypothetical protein
MMIPPGSPARRFKVEDDTLKKNRRQRPAAIPRRKI